MSWPPPSASANILKKCPSSTLLHRLVVRVKTVSDFTSQVNHWSFKRWISLCNCSILFRIQEVLLSILCRKTGCSCWGFHAFSLPEDSMIVPFNRPWPHSSPFCIISFYFVVFFPLVLIFFLDCIWCVTWSGRNGVHA